ncbi:uncharacterized protein LOC129219215 [Uloborus diversus]|uniref:uncharacterized protein LOC129219215 n=1 Tax=Uloborus diversus TaxID=327109 RepID=UPI002409B81C|nr:uncharacterized protein LOC129219215 [Uloborus diversus]
MSNMFRGTAGVDYPDLNTIPTTSFRCSEQVYEGGLYADVEARCQVYHVCHDGRKDSFLCGKGTIFNQQILACDYWYSTECETAPNFYYINSQIGGGNVPDAPQYENQPYLTQNQPNFESYSRDQTNYQQEARDSNSYNGNNDHINEPGEAYYGNQRQPDVEPTWGREGNYMQPRNENQNFNSPSDQSSCQGWGYNNNKTPWSFPLRNIMNGSDK